MLKKLIVIAGPTASGKSALAVKLAQKFDGEVVSADSRQVYRGMDIGSGKITKKEMQKIPHYLLNVASPRSTFTVVKYRQLSIAAIKKIQKADKLPILCGGAGFYISAVVDGIVIPPVKPDWRLRKKLEKLTTGKLYVMLAKIDPRRAKTIDKQNPRRLIRAIEIAKKIGAVPELKKQPLPYPVLFLGIKISPKELEAKIDRRLAKRLKAGMIAEVKQLKSAGLSWKRLENFGLEYKFGALYLQKKISRQEMINAIKQTSKQYARRQMTWFCRDPRIIWITNTKQAVAAAKKYLRQ